MDNRRWTDEISLIIFLYTLKAYIYGEGLLVTLQSVINDEYQFPITNNRLFVKFGSAIYKTGPVWGMIKILASWRIEK